MKKLYKPKVIVSIIIGILVAWIVSMILLLLCTSMVLHGTITLETTKSITIGIHFISILLGTVVLGLMSEKKIVSCIGVVSSMLFLVFCVVVLAYHGDFANIVPYLLADFAATIIAIFVINLINKRNITTKKRYRSR